MTKFLSLKIKLSRLVSPLTLSGLLFPISVKAQPTTFSLLVEDILEIINILIPALFGLAFIYVMWKVIDAWVINGGDQTKRQEGKQLLMIAVLMFVLMLTTWGIVALLRNTFFGG